jgi:hypothetical protein
MLPPTQKVYCCHQQVCLLFSSCCRLWCGSPARIRFCAQILLALVTIPLALFIPTSGGIIITSEGLPAAVLNPSWSPVNQAEAEFLTAWLPGHMLLMDGAGSPAGFLDQLSSPSGHMPSGITSVPTFQSSNDDYLLASGAVVRQPVSCVLGISHAQQRRVASVSASHPSSTYAHRLSLGRQLPGQEQQFSRNSWVRAAGLAVARLETKRRLSACLPQPPQANRLAAMSPRCNEHLQGPSRNLSTQCTHQA